jgi:ribosomal protein S6
VVDTPKGEVGRVDEVEKAGDTRLSLPSYIDKGRAAQYVQAEAKSQESAAVSQLQLAMSLREERAQP